MKMYAGNLATKTTETTLRNAFEAHGAVESCNLSLDKETGSSRGFGFIEMNNSEEAKAAISALDGSDLDGNKIKVNESNQKSKQTTESNSKS